MPHSRIVIAGGTGFLGRALAAHYADRGHQVLVLTRSPRPSTGRITYLGWNGRSVGIWRNVFEGASAAINLVGRSVNCRHTPANRREILQSRLDSVQAVNEAIQRCHRPPRVLIQASSLAIYGDTGSRACDETAPTDADDFGAEVCRQWEAAFHHLDTPHTRRIILRIGFVLGREGGALALLERLTRWGLGGAVGHGRQFISWLHLHDFVRMVDACLERDDLTGTFNATGPAPETNADFMHELRRALGRPWSPPAPVWAVRLACLLLRTEPSLALTSRRCIPRRLQQHGFTFHHPDLRPALEDLFHDHTTTARLARTPAPQPQ